MEHGDPFSNGWFAFNGSVGGGGISANAVDLPPADGGNFSLETGWGGSPGFYGGFGRTFLTDLTGADTFTFWINPNADQEYTLEINLQDDDDGDNAITNGVGGDDEYQFNCVISASGPCATAGGGWQKVEIPFSDFYLDTTGVSGGNGVLDAVPVSGGGNGQLVNIVYAVIGTGTDANFRTDYWSFTEQIVDDFEDTLFTGVDGDGIGIGFYTFQDANTTIEFTRTITSSRPGSSAGNTVLQIDSNVALFGGVIHGFENEALDTWEPQNWSPYQGISFWLYGSNTGATIFIDLLDNRNPSSTTDDAERFTYEFSDDFSGWQLFEIPFADFTVKGIGNGAPNDGLTLTEMHGWAFGIFNPNDPITTTNYIDDVRLFGTAEVPELTISFDASQYKITEGGDAVVNVKLTRELGLDAGDPIEVTVDYASEQGSATPARDYIDASGTLTFTLGGPTTQSFTVPTIDNSKHDGDKTVILRLSNPISVSFGASSQAIVIIEDEEPYDPTLLDDFERGAFLWSASSNLNITTPEIAITDTLALPGQGDFERVLKVQKSQASVSPDAFNAPYVQRDFPIGQDLSASPGMEFWFYGNNTGETITVTLKDNRAADPGPTGWSLVWSDEFDDAAGTPPNPDYWSYEIGDGAVNEIPGWGNDELQYYTNSTENSATDGSGNLVITAKEATGEQCYYGDCKYTSARLISQYKAEFAYGRIESRILVPSGEAGLWPAFWSLGTDIGEVDWPQTGEIDIMEYVSRLPNELFGTIHGPGYSGGASFGNVYDFGEPVYNNYHTFAIEWEPDLIKWYVDDILYHTAVPADVSPNQWVFNDPVFLILNMAIGGNFGGSLSPDLTFPQEMKVDYVRVFQGPDTAERFVTSFVDNFSGWQEVTVPFGSFSRSAIQPVGAPDDGLTLNDVWGYGFELPQGSLATGDVLIDQVRFVLYKTLTVVNLNDSGSGSLRQALYDIAPGGTILFDPGLSGGTIQLTTGPLIPIRDVTIDGSVLANLARVDSVRNGIITSGITVDGGGTDRVMIIDAARTVTAKNITMQNGFGFQLAGGVLNNGNLTLDHVDVKNNVMVTDSGDFWQGGGGIYNGEYSTLNLIDSTVSGNIAGWSGGGIYAFFNAQVNILRSTVSGNITADTGGGIRSLGNMNITNSTISGNTSTGWHAGALFATDGVIDIVNSTITDNAAPETTTGGLFVGTFGDSSVTVNLKNTIVAGNTGDECFLAFFGGGAVTLKADGNNLFTDGTCNPGASDLIVDDAGLGLLERNGGPTRTHALLNGSAAIDAGSNTNCPLVDQRGIDRPQSGTCDIGAYERADFDRPYKMILMPIFNK